jgi:hypothetical protein
MIRDMLAGDAWTLLLVGKEAFIRHPRSLLTGAGLLTAKSEPARSRGRSVLDAPLGPSSELTCAWGVGRGASAWGCVPWTVNRRSGSLRPRAWRLPRASAAGSARAALPRCRGRVLTGHGAGRARRGPGSATCRGTLRDRAPTAGGTNVPRPLPAPAGARVRRRGRRAARSSSATVVPFRSDGGDLRDTGVCERVERQMAGAWASNAGHRWPQTTAAAPHSAVRRLRHVAPAAWSNRCTRGARTADAAPRRRIRPRADAGPASRDGGAALGPMHGGPATATAAAGRRGSRPAGRRRLQTPRTTPPSAGPRRDRLPAPAMRHGQHRLLQLRRLRPRLLTTRRAAVRGRHLTAWAASPGRHATPDARRSRASAASPAEAEAARPRLRISPHHQCVTAPRPGAASAARCASRRRRAATGRRCRPLRLRRGRHTCDPGSKTCVVCTPATAAPPTRAAPDHADHRCADAPRIASARDDAGLRPGRGLCKVSARRTTAAPAAPSATPGPMGAASVTRRRRLRRATPVCDPHPDLRRVLRLAGLPAGKVCEHPSPGGACVGCLSSASCGGATPFCNPSTGTASLHRHQGLHGLSARVRHRRLRRGLRGLPVPADCAIRRRSATGDQDCVASCTSGGATPPSASGWRGSVLCGALSGTVSCGESRSVTCGVHPPSLSGLGSASTCEPMWSSVRARLGQLHDVWGIATYVGGGG